jgi:ketosteroid isomerase-like protein
MSAPEDALTADREFFNLLLAGDGAELSDLLADSFQLIAVATGEVVSKAELVGALDSGLLRFHMIAPTEVQTRTYGDCAVVTGRTEMSVTMGTHRSAVRSRYTHVYVRQGAAWRMVSAQGTPIVENSL